MNAVFADTFYWIAFTNAQDTAHEKAREFTVSAKPGAIYLWQTPLHAITREAEPSQAEEATRGARQPGFPNCAYLARATL